MEGGAAKPTMTERVFGSSDGARDTADATAKPTMTERIFGSSDNTTTNAAAKPTMTERIFGSSDAAPATPSRSETSAVRNEPGMIRKKTSITTPAHVTTPLVEE